MSQSKMTRRTFMAGTAASIAIAGCGDSGGAGGASGGGAGSTRGPAKGRVVILGFDGVEPTIIQEMINQGELPNFAKLSQGGTFKKLGSTIPPQSPVAWTSFSTCKNPGGHNIYDFIRRNPRGPRGPFPAVGTGELKHPKFSADGSVQEEPKLVTYRKGDTFWKVADQQGLKCKVLNVPFATPADELKNGIQLCGLGVTDVRGTTSTSYDLSDTFTQSELQGRLSGGMRLKLNFTGSDVATVALPGPRNTSHKFGTPEAYTASSIEISVDRKNGQGSVRANETNFELKEGVWSEWVQLSFPMTSKYTAHAVVRFFPIEIGESVRIYTTCAQISPEHPYASYSYPDSYAKEMHERYGRHKTIGWAFDTHGLRQDRMDEEMFLADIRETMAWREKLTLDEIDRGDFDLLISAWTATDRIGHMFWRFRDEKHPMYDPEMAKIYAKTLEESYRICDRITGNVMAKLQPDDLLMILSDHGFESFRRGFDVNKWLEDHGYLAVNNRKAAEQGFLGGIDWGKTDAYGIGLSSLYLNITGRERYGKVSPGNVDNMIAKLREEMLTAKDDKTGLKVFSNIYTRDNFSGEAMADAPDISFGYTNHYQAAKSAAKGAVGTELCMDNTDKWSGEHASSDFTNLPGIFFCNQNVEADDPNILDLGVIALGYLGADVPADYEGRDLLA